MARKYPAEYDISKVAEIVRTERAFRRDVDLRLDALETTVASLGSDANVLVARVVHAIETEISPRAAEIEALLADYREGVPAERVQEETDGRQFLTPTRRAAILAELRGGVDASGDTLAKLLALISALDAAKATPADITAAIAAAIAALKGGAPAAYDTLVEIATWIASDETAEAAITAALAQRLRLDAAGGYSPAQQAQGLTNLGIADLSRGVFAKADPRAAVFTRTGNGTVSLKANTVIEIGGVVYTVHSATALLMPALVAGTDYAAYACDDQTVRADASFSGPAGYAGAWRRIGGFHYGPGGMATAFNGGGNTTPQVLAHSMWDEKFRMACDDPRGMGFVSPAVGWVDLYPTIVDALLYGTSRNGVAIADGSSPPKVPLSRGGNGTTTYSTFTWWEAAELLEAFGKRLLTPAQYQAAAFGAKENVSRGNDPVTTGLATTNVGSSRADHELTSMYMYNAVGTMWAWGAAHGGGAAAAGWVNNNGGRGQTYQQENAVILGGNWGDAADAGSRAAFWNYSPSASYGNIGARGCCDHVCHV